MTGQQERLFVVAEQTGQVAPVDFSDSQETAVSWEERNIHLQNVITTLAHMSMLNGFISYEGPSQAYGERAQRVRENAQERLRILTHEAKESFAHASGHYALLESGYPKEQARSITRGLFSDFSKKYYGHRHHKSAQNYRRKLADDIRLMHSFQPAPVIREAEDVPDERLADTELDNHGKLRAILNDERAGFLPATNNEKTKILTLLDYIDRKDGTAQQLIEIFRHSHGFIKKEDVVRTAGVREGRRAVESVIYEIGDFTANAVASHAKLAQLQRDLAEILNPKLTLEVALGDSHDGFAPLARFRALKKLYEERREKVLSSSVDPMKTVTNRWAEDGPGKHKELGDRYTSDEREPHIDAEIRQFAGTITVFEARQYLEEALVNEEKRANFFLARLQEVEALAGISWTFESLVKVSEEIMSKYEKPA